MTKNETAQNFIFLCLKIFKNNFAEAFGGGLLFIFLSSSSPVFANLELSEKHLIILRAGIDSLWGDYVFSVQNNSPAPQPTKIPLFLPAETVDFKAVEGIEAADLRLDTESGAVILAKDFTPGATVVNVGFKVEAEAGKSILTFTATQPIPSVNVLYEGEILTVRADPLLPTVLPKIADVNYHALHTQHPLTIEEELVITVTGIPRGRKIIHVFAVIFTVSLLLSTLWMGIKTAPRGD